MKTEIRERWTAALRSGKYAQGRQALRAGDTFCCLGVLCELAAQDGIVAREKLSHDSVTSYGGSDTYLPQAVMEWAGLDKRNPSVPRSVLSDEDANLTTCSCPLCSEGGNPDKVKTLAGLNDVGVPFARIADYIDAALAEENATKENELVPA